MIRLIVVCPCKGAIERMNPSASSFPGSVSDQKTQTILEKISSDMGTSILELHAMVDAGRASGMHCSDESKKRSNPVFVIASENDIQF
ncbi:unnamed protein product [Brugia timori]|uniref:60S ribosomal protein L12 n=1 Tax=Brugia timori TaxID=42155 RepID=A0A0R3QWG2_9BILA|nr:unnamed protein product [Brugia timori]